MRNQLVRVVTHRTRLNQLYGEGYFAHLLQRVDAWKSAAAVHGVSVEELVLIDDLPGGDLPAALKRRLARLNRKPADAVLILGGPDIVPFYPIRSPEFLVPDDDAEILSDDPYVAFDPHNVSYKPECPIGRLPDGGAYHPNLLMDLLTRCAEHHRQTTRFVPLGLTSATWQTEARAVFDSCGELYACPPRGLPGCACVTEPITPEWLRSYTFQYYNAYGTFSNEIWYCQCGANGSAPPCNHSRVPLLNANSVPALSNTFVFSAASYSARLASPAQSNLALQFLSQGAVCYVGTTATAYCAAPGAAPGAADQIAQWFIAWVHQNTRGTARLSVGEILKRAKLSYPASDNFDRKTLVEYVLFGDPTVVPFQQ